MAIVVVASMMILVIEGSHVIMVISGCDYDDIGYSRMYVIMVVSGCYYDDTGYYEPDSCFHKSETTMRRRVFVLTQRSFCPLIQEYTLNHNG